MRVVEKTRDEENARLDQERKRPSSRRLLVRVSRIVQRGRRVHDFHLIDTVDTRPRSIEHSDVALLDQYAGENGCHENDESKTAEDGREYHRYRRFSCHGYVSRARFEIAVTASPTCMLLPAEETSLTRWIPEWNCSLELEHEL